MRYDRKMVRVESLAVQRAYELQGELGFHDSSYLGQYRLSSERGQAPTLAQGGLVLYDEEGREVGFEQGMRPVQFGLTDEIDEFSVTPPEDRHENWSPPDGPFFIERTYSFEFLSSDRHEVVLHINVCYAKRTREAEWKLSWETAFEAHPISKTEYSWGQDCLLKRKYGADATP